MTQKAVVTLCIGDAYKALAKYSHPVFKAYADRVRADFVLLDSFKMNFPTEILDCKNIGGVDVTWEKFQMYDVLSNYDLALFLDTDILISPLAPNIFDLASDGNIYGVFEDFGDSTNDRRERIVKVQSNMGQLGNWTTGYMNSGVFMVPACHKEAFRLYLNAPPWMDFNDQTPLNWYFRKAAGSIQGLDCRWNYMGISSEFYKIPRRHACFIHYAGNGFSGKGREADMIADLQLLYGERAA